MIAHTAHVIALLVLLLCLACNAQDGSQSQNFQTKLIRPVHMLKPCATADAPDDLGVAPQSPFLLFYLATVPRSGNTLSRILLENASGIATETVYSNNQRGFKKTNRTHAFAPPCGGITGDCASVHRSRGPEPVVVKTPFPFLTEPVTPPALPHAPSAQQCVSGVITTLRHPIDNYVAWIRYLSAPTSLLGHPHNNSLPGTTVNPRVARDGWPLDRFMQLWVQHHTFWRRFARLRGVPLLEYRFEDLCSDPRRVLPEVLAFTQMYSPTRQAQQARQAQQDVLATPNTCVLKKYARDPVTYALFTDDELDDALLKYRKQMQQFGYSDGPWGVQQRP